MVGQQHKLDSVCWQALKSGSIHTMACLRILVEQAKFMVAYAILLAILLALNASPANKWQYKFQLGLLKTNTLISDCTNNLIIISIFN